MPIEEKAKEYAGITPDVTDIEWLGKFAVTMENRIAYEKYKAYLAGYNEAMRWRDGEEEVPENEEIV